jgi:cell division protein FtsI/penicillin-binding protein 2
VSESRPDHITWRHRVLALLVLAGLIAITVRLVQVQVLRHDEYLEQAAVTRLGAVQVPAPRGAILDATGYPLAISVDTWDLYIDRFLWRDRERARDAASALGEAIGRDPEELFAMGTSADSGDLIIERGMEYEEGLALDERELWGVRLIPSSVRLYPEGDLAGPLIGYVGLDHEGLWGVESDFDHILRGRGGWLSTERDPLGRPIAFGARSERPPAPGGEVQLTIDRFIQEIAERRLAEALEEYQAPSGSIVVMQPHTGAILAMASLPAVRLSDIDLADPDLAEGVRLRSMTDLYEPGSVLKTLTTAAAIDLGHVTPETMYEDEGVVEVGEYEIRNWDFQAYGEVTVREYLQRSLNTGAVWLSDEIGANAFYRYLRAFGLGEPTHLGLSGEAEGLMRTPEDPDWYPVDLATNSYGQGLAATPLQVLTAINSFANGGILMRPYVVSKVVTASAVRSYQPVEVRRVVADETARTMAALMRDVVEGVQWHGARVPGYEVAGKTGTTLVSIPTGYDLDTTIASFAGFLPYERPAVSILVKIDQPGGERNLGGEVAAPVFARVAADVMDYLQIAPSLPAGTPRVVAP